jgi:hypothetical protein
MKSQKTTQTMKPATAAKKLGIHLQAAPVEFQEGVVSRDELNALQADPPKWLRDLRADGPHPRAVSAARLGVSIAGLARGGVTEPLTTEQIETLKQEQPDWLLRERETQAEVRREAARIKDKQQQEAEPGATGGGAGGRGGGESSRGRGTAATGRTTAGRTGQQGRAAGGRATTRRPGQSTRGR